MISKRFHKSFPHGEGRVPRRFKGTAIYWVGLLVLCGLLLPSVGQARLRNSVQRDQWLPVLDIPNQVSFVSDRCDGMRCQQNTVFDNHRSRKPGNFFPTY